MIRALRPPGPQDHFMKLADARLCPTRATRLNAENIKTILDADSMMCVHGGVGLGKSLAAERNLYDLAPDTSLYARYPREVPLKHFRADLMDALGLPADDARDRRLSERLVLEALQTPRALIVDEAQALGPAVYEYIRYLSEDTPLSVVFVGGENCYQRLRRQAALASRIAIWQAFAPLTTKEVLEHIPAYHPLWKDVSPDDLLWANEAACHGNFRTWARFTHLVHQELNHPDSLDSTVTPALMREVMHRMNPLQFRDDQHPAATS
ncbi:AAA family ATPase [Streptomyces griseoluteus]|uniref:AAA family ATPase n=1 Tax=Streptomyces griseoluteus TaxID=29306 RepID=UPI0036FC5FF4